jgi:deoxyribonuclease-4
MILGAHESVAGGLPLVFERCTRDRARALQLWTRSSRQWAAPPLDDAVVCAFRKLLLTEQRKGPFPTAAHASYLINLATANDFIRRRSTATLLDECLRAERLGVRQVIVHPGAAVGASRATSIRNVSRSLRTICAALRRKRVRLLLEFTAGQGSCVGCSFEELAEMLQQTGERRIGICLDTQHLYAAGIEWTTARGYEKTFDDFDRIVGLPLLEAFHLNDSKRPLGSRVDRHAVIGEGFIGLRPFGRLIRDPRFAHLPGYLETPPLASGEESYAVGLARLRSVGPRTSRNS